MAEQVSHPAGPATSAGALAYLICARVPDWDITVEGLAFPELRAQSSQFHPEASPGPHDGASIIADWVEELKAVA